MAFKLLIECSKDIDELHINFSDGTSVVTESKKPKDSSNTIKHNKLKNNDSSIIKNSNNNKEYMNTNDDYNNDISSEIIEKPDVTVSERPIIIADELQNLDL